MPTINQTAEAIVNNFIIQNTARYRRAVTVGQLRDLLVIVDSSGSIGRTFFNDAKSQLARLLGLLCPKPNPFKGYQKAALIEYSTTVLEIFDFDDNSNTNEVQQGVESMTYMNGLTATATAFNYAKETMFKTEKGKLFLINYEVRLICVQT